VELPCILFLTLLQYLSFSRFKLLTWKVTLRLYLYFVDMQKALAGIVPAIEKARLYRGKGGEIMRSAVSRFISCISVAGISLNDKTKKSLLETLNENLRHPNSQIQVKVYFFLDVHSIRVRPSTIILLVFPHSICHQSPFCLCTCTFRILY